MEWGRAAECLPFGAEYMYSRTQMVIYDDNVGLESFMQCASRISQRLTACNEDEAKHQLDSHASGPPVPEPMRMDKWKAAWAWKG